MEIGDRIPAEIEVTGWDEHLGAFRGEVRTPDWFLSESGYMLQCSNHWRHAP